jgi:predicted GTPase
MCADRMMFEGEIRKQVELAIDEADVIIFVDVEELPQWMMLPACCVK